MKQEEQRIMEGLQKTNTQLPSNIEDLSKFVLVGRERLASVRAAIRAIDKVGVAKEVREQKLKEGQDIAEAVLDAEIRIGELAKVVPKESGGDHGNQHTGGKTDSSVAFGKSPKQEFQQKVGLPERQIQRFQVLAEHPEEVQAAKEAARKAEKMVSRSDVLERIPKRETPAKAFIRREAEHEAFKKAKDEMDVIPVTAIQNDRDTLRMLALDMDTSLRSITSEVMRVNLKYRDNEKEYMEALTDTQATITMNGLQNAVRVLERYIEELRRQ